MASQGQGSDSKPLSSLDSLTQEPQSFVPPFSMGIEPPLPATPRPMTPLQKEGVDITSVPKNKYLSLAKVWTKYLLKRPYAWLDPVAKKLKIPTFVFMGLLAAVFVGAIIGIGALSGRSSVALVNSIQPIHMIQVNSNQVSELDITAYTDLQNQLQNMGFQSLLQVTVLQLPSPNFFDVSMKETAETYGEILKMPGQITPRLSFITVFKNGVWFSTNGWPGDNLSTDYLISEHYPNDTPDQLYVQHMQTLVSLKQKDWQVQSMSENRYMAALSDHLREFLDKKGVLPYQADFNLWH